MSEKIRVHLKQAILVGPDDEARYSKVLIAERESLVDYRRPDITYQAFTVSGYVWGYRRHELPRPTRIWLSDRNILAIDNLEAEPRVSQPIKIKACASSWPHVPHTFRDVGPVTNCPGGG